MICLQEEEAGEEGASAAELGVENVGGVFVVLGVGCGIAAAMGLFEFLWHVKDVAIEQKVNYFTYGVQVRSKQRTKRFTYNCAATNLFCFIILTTPFDVCAIMALLLILVGYN